MGRTGGGEKAGTNKERPERTDRREKGENAAKKKKNGTSKIREEFFREKL